MCNKTLWSLLALLAAGQTAAQIAPAPDTLQPRTLREISISAERSTIERLPQVSGTYLLLAISTVITPNCASWVWPSDGRSVVVSVAVRV